MTPKEAAIEVEKLLKDAGFILKDLSFVELVGTRLATYDFGDHEVTKAQNIDGSGSIYVTPVSERR